MDLLPRVPPGGRCTCGEWLWYVRPRDVGGEGTFQCRARHCGRRYRPQEERWQPYVEKHVSGFGETKS